MALLDPWIKSKALELVSISGIRYPDRNHNSLWNFFYNIWLLPLSSAQWCYPRIPTMIPYLSWFENRYLLSADFDLLWPLMTHFHWPWDRKLSKICTISIIQPVSQLEIISMVMSTSIQQPKLTHQQRLDLMSPLVLTSSFTKVRIHQQGSTDWIAWSVNPYWSWIH